MFRTHLQAEVKGAVAFGDGLRVWRYVEQAVQCPWLYVCWTEKSGEVTLSSMLMVADMSLFEDMLARQTESLRVENVLLVSPKHLNRSASWLMEGLVELCEAIGPACEHLAYVYRLEGGSSYWDGYVQDPQHTPLRVIYSRS
ncbi:TPA: hypothetical protein NIC80_005434 [Pseudomonas aeruginosa]|jgi:hypothetical protein|uniref:hypothetical protein n=2 Tax=Pseudomonas aeruginosa TaxID=287 RepID=UPI00068AF317|nr:hypothetical protein [Pseudomonas aeruginosa]ELH0226809.1 hypothetical protein [Pseudomonas aeruginosa]MBG4386202.1 hypothetical protein [Pseudomonas aeruginosa]MCO3800405.1 hypothetical protein [Pseudomonas aeruginosa]MCO4044777.1 hypothetical protein [Pseudomonas aeruginosa]MCS9387186.1 hypothetical protein [Pseudomonas aeruginosa]